MFLLVVIRQVTRVNVQAHWINFISINSNCISTVFLMQNIYKKNWKKNWTKKLNKTKKAKKAKKGFNSSSPILHTSSERCFCWLLLDISLVSIFRLIGLISFPLTVIVFPLYFLSKIFESSAAPTLAFAFAFSFVLHF